MRTRELFVWLVIAGLISLAAGCSGTPLSADVDGHMVMLPRVFRAGEATGVGFTLFAGEDLGQGRVQISLLDAGSRLAKAEGRIAGKGTVVVEVPRVAAGEYQVEIAGPGFQESASVQIKPGTLVLLETDKPVYRPGQTVLMRVFTLDSSLRPDPAQVTVEALDARGIRVMRQTVAPDEFGMAALELPLSAEPNLGVWRFTAASGDSSTQVDVRVERYVLPKYEVAVETVREWFLADEAIEGSVSAVYSFGRAVQGRMEISAWRYVGGWEQYASYSAAIDGKGSFRLEPVRSVAGVPEAGGLGNVRLDVSVVEEATGYRQECSEFLNVASSPLTIKIIAEGGAFKPGLPFSLLLATETPSGEAVESAVAVECAYYGEDGGSVGLERQEIQTKRGTALVRLAPPEGAVRFEAQAATGDARNSKTVFAAYSPSDSFLHVEQFGSSVLRVGDAAVFSAFSTSEARTIYYEVVSHDRVVFTDSSSGDIQFRVTPAMAGDSRLLVYQLLPTGEVAADSLPFTVEGEYPQDLTATFDQEEARPGATVKVRLRAEGRAKIGLTAVDRSVFILAENRLNLQQVFAELERLYMQPHVELHQADGTGPLLLPGAEDAFTGAGLLVLSDKEIPAGRTIQQQDIVFGAAGEGAAGDTGDVVSEVDAAGGGQAGDGTAEVQRIRQYFPETWIWEDVTTEADGRATLSFEVPDSITSWDLRAVSVSPEKGLGIAEASLRAFQPFFLSVDLPCAVMRGEEFPVEVAVYNYLDTPQEFVVEIEEAPWFQLQGLSAQKVLVAANEVGAAAFTIRPATLGTQVVKVTARSGQTADAVNKSMIVEAEGVGREVVTNAVLRAGSTLALDLSVPVAGVVAGSERAYLSVAGSLLAQSIGGLDQLLQMPFGCGEQNMILFAPDAFILRYLERTGQLQPEIRAKAQMLLTTGYQRELTFRRADGSFSAFGESDQQGSLFLTAFVLKTFAQARGLTYIDETVLAEAGAWIVGLQQGDGSFESVGFVHHQEMMGGVQGKDALTAYVAVALLEAGQTEAAGEALSYLGARLGEIEDPYSVALAAYALTLGESPLSSSAVAKLLALAVEDERGLHWEGGETGPPGQQAGAEATGLRPRLPGLDVEVTGYATLALTGAGETADAARAAGWLVSHRNSAGGFATTQDTVVALQALSELAGAGAAKTDLTLRVAGAGLEREVKLSPQKADVTQVVEVPVGTPLTITAEGRGEAVVQGVVRYNLVAPAEPTPVFDIDVTYDALQVDVDDTVRAAVEVVFNPPPPRGDVQAGMVVVDVSVPTGFAAETASLEALLETPHVKRYDQAGRKVLVYLEDMTPGQRISLWFTMRALYPVKAKGSVSQAYSYYRPEWKGETVGGPMSVR